MKCRTTKRKGIKLKPKQLNAILKQQNVAIGVYSIMKKAKLTSLKF